MELFNKLLNYRDYLKENPFHQNLAINLEDYGQLDKKIIRKKQYSVDPEWEEHDACSAELDDLIDLNMLVIFCFL